jgi:hypothetical protein
MRLDLGRPSWRLEARRARCEMALAVEDSHDAESRVLHTNIHGK